MMIEKFGEGVRFLDDDYAGLLRRLLILIIDSVVVIFIISIGSYADSAIYEKSLAYEANYGIYVSLAISFLYLTKIKASNFGTLGQIITNTKILTIYGSKPGMLRMMCRSFFWVIGPLNLVVDILFLTLIKEKRTIRDCYCGTIIVKKSAKPIEFNVPVRVARVFAFGLYIAYTSCYQDSI